MPEDQDGAVRAEDFMNRMKEMMTKMVSRKSPRVGIHATIGTNIGCRANRSASNRESCPANAEITSAIAASLCEPCASPAGTTATGCIQE